MVTMDHYWEVIGTQPCRFQWFLSELQRWDASDLFSVFICSNCRLRWFGRVERKDDNDWVSRCITSEVEGIREDARKRPGAIVL